MKRKKRKKNRNDMSAKELKLNELLVEKLKFHMAEKDLTIHDVSMLINKDPKTVWQFLRRKVKPNDRTIYKIKTLVGENVKKSLAIKSKLVKE